jgi:hypothetical protein
VKTGTGACFKISSSGPDYYSSMRDAHLWIAWLASALLQASGPAAVVRTFDDEKVGTAPAGFTFAAGREALPGRWVVQRDAAGQVLARTGADQAQDGFAVAVYGEAQYENVELSVRLKAETGAGSAGLVWKYQDPANHYSAQLDLGRQVLAVYRVAGGNRILLEREDDLELDPHAWHSLRVVNDPGEIRVYLGGIRVFRERDRGARGGGGVGLWVAGSAAASFDDFRVAPREVKGR